ncbi:MAG: hypothetical protein F4173_11035 [Acidobacteriia bacterium]|nr:hypothetical protein [Terriglobia bacterium]
MDLGGWIERVYEEEDFGRNIAIAAAGAAGLGAYLLQGDWVVAAFVAVIVFSIVKVAASSWHSDRKQSRERSDHTDRMNRLFEDLSPREQAVVRAFVSHGGCVVSWANATPSKGFDSTGIDSLIKRRLIYSSISVDGIRDTFELDAELFDYAQALVAEDLPEDTDDIPF